MNHGTITPTHRPSSASPRIPRSLQVGVIELPSGFMNHEKSVEKYGHWEVVALADFHYLGTKIAKGDRARIPGNVAWLGTRQRDLQFVDARMDAEDAAAAEVARLAIPLAAKDNPAFSAPRREFAHMGFSDK